MGLRLRASLTVQHVIVGVRQALPQHVLVTRAHAARVRFLSFLRGVWVAGLGEARCVTLASATSAALIVGVVSRGLSATDKRADASADIAVNIAAITHIRPSIKSRPNILMFSSQQSSASRGGRQREF